MTCLVDDVWRAQQANARWQSANHCNGVGEALGEVTYRCEARLNNQTGQPAGQLKVEGALQFQPTSLSWQGPFQLDVVDAAGQVHLAERALSRAAALSKSCDYPMKLWS